MKIEVESTEYTVPSGRVWQGVTSKGTPITVIVSGIEGGASLEPEIAALGYSSQKTDELATPDRQPSLPDSKKKGWWERRKHNPFFWERAHSNISWFWMMQAFWFFIDAGRYAGPSRTQALLFGALMLVCSGISIWKASYWKVRCEEAEKQRAFAILDSAIDHISGCESCRERVMNGEKPEGHG